MYPDYVTDARLRKAIKDALAEDIGPGDYTSLSSVPSNAIRSAKLLFKEEGIAAGLELAGFIFKQIDKTLKVEFHKIDGDEVKKGDVGFIVTGPAQSILKAERLVLNCMQRMCGIATLTREYVRQISHTRAKLLDTRKTTPNFRIFEKWAVRIGGGQNHRFGLYDMILLKDNHIDYAGGVRKAILNTVKYLQDNNLDLKIEIEVRNLEELKQVLDTGKINRILLDNMLLSVMAEAIKMVNRQYETEASGGVNINTIKSIAETGVDFISVGKITHSFKSMDISLKAV